QGNDLTVDLHLIDIAGILKQALKPREHSRARLAPERKARRADALLCQRHLIEPLRCRRRGVAALLREIEEEDALDALLDLLAEINRRVHRRRVVERL